MLIEVMVVGDEKAEYFFAQKVVGILLDVMATLFGTMDMTFFDDEKNIEFSKCRSDHFRGPNRRKLGQGNGQNLVWTIFEKVQKSMLFQLFGKRQKIIVF